MSAPTRFNEATQVRSRRIRRTTVGVVGAGRVGAVMAAALARAGYRVVAVSTKDVDRVRALLPAKTAVATAVEVAVAVDLVLLAVPDDALAEVVHRLVLAGAFRPGQVVAHTSGAHGLAVLRPALDQGALGLALHPAMSFTGGAEDLDRLATGISFGVTADDRLRPLAEQIVSDLHGSIEWVAESARALYHAALVHGANHLVTLVNEALDRLRDTGVRRPEQVLAPLLKACLENTLRLGDGALTGPVSRGDAGTIAKHLRILMETAPDSVPVYLSLARRTADRAIASGRLSPSDAGPLLGVLAHSVVEPEPEAIVAAEPSLAVPVSVVPAVSKRRRRG